MKPEIGRSIKQGFVAANRSWAAIGLFIGSWVLVIIVALVGVALTKPPAALFQEPATTSKAEAPAVRPASPQPASTPATQKTDLFNQLATTDAATPSAPNAPSPAPDAAAVRREEIAQRDRLAGEWFGRAWPVLFLVFLVVMAANLWLTGGQIGYLAKRVTAGQAKLSEFWASGTRAFGALVGGSLLSMAGLAGLALVGVLITVAFSVLANIAPNWGKIVLRLVGLILGLAILVGLIWLLVRLSFWFIAIVADRLGPIAGLRRSFRATRGQWWKIAGLGLLMSLISYGVWLPFGLLDWVSRQIGGAGEVGIGILSNLLGVIASLYVGFAMLAAYIRFYEDANTPPSITAPTGPSNP